MNQTDKNIARAKDCGFKKVSSMTTSLMCTTNQLDEYTSRVCAEKNKRIAELDATIEGRSRNMADANALKWVDGLKIENTELRAKLAEKDALIAMQAEALDTIAELYENARNGNECAYDMRCVARQALTFTAETVEAWKNKQVADNGN